MRTRRIPPGWRAYVDKDVHDMHDKGIFRPSSSAFAVPLCPVRKKDGTLRLCVDYRALNCQTRDGAFPTSNLVDVLDSMAGARYFNTIDLARGYYHVPMREEDEHKMAAFRSHSALWEFNVMPFGLIKGAPATFCRLMHLALVHMGPEQLSLYMDDVWIISSTFENHLQRLQKTFEALLHHGLRIRADKCSFAMHEVESCGHCYLYLRKQPRSTGYWSPAVTQGSAVVSRHHRLVPKVYPKLCSLGQTSHSSTR